MIIDPKVQKVLDQLLKLPMYQKGIILLAISTALAVGYYFLFFTPKVLELDQKKGALVTQMQKLAEDRDLASDLPRHKKDFERLQVVLERSLSQLPNKSEIPSLLTSIGSLARDSGLEIKKFKPLPENKKTFYADVPLQIDLLGTYHDVVKFFNNVSKLSRIVNIGNLELGSPKLVDGRVQLKIKCLATTFRFLSAEEQTNTGRNKTRGRRKR